jgi:hypothetical protein
MFGLSLSLECKGGIMSSGFSMPGPIELIVIALIVLVGFVVPLIVLVTIVSSQAKKKRKQLDAEPDSVNT